MSFDKNSIKSEREPRGCGQSWPRLTRSRMKRIKQSYVTRRLPLAQRYRLRSDKVALAAGDIVLAQIVSIGQHRRIELPTGRRAELHLGDEVLLACGARYAADQFEAAPPKRLGPCSMVAAGGLAAVLSAKHSKMKASTKIEAIAVLCDEAGRKVNLRDFALEAPHPHSTSTPTPPIVTVVGASMNAGKTTAAAAIIRGLTAGKLNVAACKITGTGAGCDAWKYLDAGAISVLDFTDAGRASTVGLDLSELEQIARTLINACAADADIIVVEIADGLLQAETSALLQSPMFRSLTDSIVYAAGDPMAAAAGVDRLRAWGYEPALVSGILTASPIAMREAQAIINVPIVTSSFLTDDADMSSIVLHPADVRRIGAHV